MRTHVMILLSIGIFIILNYGIYQKEKINRDGTVLLLELAPVDPRSLMQGDYMQLRYAVENMASANKLPSGYRKRGYIVVSPNQNNVAEFVRFYEHDKLAANEKLLRFHDQGLRAIRIVPDSFFFHEGHAKYYQEAKYGIFKFSDATHYLLVGLADKNRTPLGMTQELSKE